MKQKNFIISEGIRPLWQRIIASLIYTGLIMGLLYVIYTSIFISFGNGCWLIVNNIALVLLFLAIAFRFSVVQTLYFDFTNVRYKKEYSAGLIKTGKWHHLPDIEYVCVFRQEVIKDIDGDGMGEHRVRFDVNIWYNNNRHITLYSNYDRDSAYEMGYELAKRLEVDLLDSTIQGEKNWINFKQSTTPTGNINILQNTTSQELA